MSAFAHLQPTDETESQHRAVETVCRRSSGSRGVPSPDQQPLHGIAVTGYGGLGLRALSRDVGLNLGRQGIATAIGLVLSVLLARLLGPTGNGRYAIALLLPTTLATMLNLGIAPANVYFIGRGEVGVRQALRTNVALWAALTGAGIVIGGFVIALKGDVWFPGVRVGYLWLAMVMFPMILLRDFTASLLQGVEDFLAYNKMMLAVPAVTLTTAAVTVAWLGWGVAGALAAVVGGSCAGVLVGSTALYTHPHGSEPSGEAKYARKCLGYGWKAHFSNALSFLNYRADVFLLNVLLAPAAVGIYVVAVQIGERLWVLSAAVSTVLLPRLSALHGEEDARRLITPLVSRWVFIVALAGSAVLAVFAGGIVRLLFGSEYLPAASALRWLLPGIAFVSASRVLANDIAARGRPELNMYTAVAVVAINVVGNVVLIPRMGIAGAAIATTISYSVDAAVKLVLYSRLSGNRWSASIVVPRSDLTLARQALSSFVGSGEVR